MGLDKTLKKRVKECKNGTFDPKKLKKIKKVEQNTNVYFFGFCPTKKFVPCQLKNKFIFGRSVDENLRSVSRVYKCMLEGFLYLDPYFRLAVIARLNNRLKEGPKNAKTG